MLLAKAVNLYQKKSHHTYSNISISVLLYCQNGLPGTKVSDFHLKDYKTFINVDASRFRVCLSSFKIIHSHEQNIICTQVPSV